MNGQFSYSRMNMNMPNFLDNAWGLNGTTRDEYNSAVGTVKREVYNAEYGVVDLALDGANRRVVPFAGVRRAVHCLRSWAC